MRTLELKIPPPVVMVIVALLMCWLARMFPAASFALAGSLVVAVVIAVISVLIAVLAAIAFKRASTTINPMNPGAAANLITTGLYSRSRNPIYLADALLLVALASYLQSSISLIGVLLFMVYISRFQIVPEERVLQKKFGQAYLDYKVKVRRWI